MTNLYLIMNCGCDDTTSGLARMTIEQAENIMYLDDRKYVLEDGLRWKIYDDEFETRKVI